MPTDFLSFLSSIIKMDRVAKQRSSKHKVKTVSGDVFLATLYVLSTVTYVYLSWNHLLTARDSKHEFPSTTNHNFSPWHCVCHLIDALASACYRILSEL